MLARAAERSHHRKNTGSLHSTSWSSCGASMTKRTNQRWYRPRKARNATRVFASPSIRGHVREAQRRQAAHPTVLVIVFSKHCVDQLQKGISTVVRKEQGKRCEEQETRPWTRRHASSMVTEERAAQQQMQWALGTNLVNAIPMVVAQ